MGWRGVGEWKSPITSVQEIGRHNLYRFHIARSKAEHFNVSKLVRFENYAIISSPPQAPKRPLTADYPAPFSHPIPTPWTVCLLPRNHDGTSKIKRRKEKEKSKMWRNLPLNTLCRETCSTIHFLPSKIFAAWSKRKSYYLGRKTFVVNRDRLLSDHCPTLLYKSHFALLKKEIKVIQKCSGRYSIICDSFHLLLSPHPPNNLQRLVPGGEELFKVVLYRGGRGVE